MAMCISTANKLIAPRVLSRQTINEGAVTRQPLFWANCPVVEILLFEQ